MGVHPSSTPPMPKCKPPKPKETDVWFEVSDIEVEIEVTNEQREDSGTDGEMHRSVR